MNQAQVHATMKSIEVKSGTEIVADFIEAAKNKMELDQATVTAIHSLSQAQKLTVTNLLKRLDELRGESKV